MQSNSYYNRKPHGPNVELYQEVFRVLDGLGMADLKLTFQEHCIQVLGNMILIIIISVTKFLVVIGTPPAYLSHVYLCGNQRAIMSNYRYPI